MGLSATISTKLAEQVLAALHEVMHGFQAANDASGGKLLGPVLAGDPQHVCSGLRTVLMRLVFVLYAEDRGLLSGDPVYANDYSVTGLFNRLQEDAGRFPDTMDQRFGSWSRLITLFRLVYDGGQHGDFKMPPRRGYLFDPDRYPFLEGRVASRQWLVASEVRHQPLATSHRSPATSPPRIPDGVIYRVLRNLLILDGERVSYRTLDVESIGNVYETVMGFNLDVAHGESIVLQPSDERRRSGSHYTPRSLTDSIVRRTLEPVLQQLVGGHSSDINDQGQMTKDTRRLTHREQAELRRREQRQTEAAAAARRVGTPHPSQILELKICDPAMGSGAFLLEACRQLGDELVKARHAHDLIPSDMPPDEDEVLYARRQVAQRCLYGVDKNPMAVDLAKLSLWLVTQAKDHPFTFLDHSLRHGDSLVGLTRRQIIGFHWEPKQQKQKPFGGDLIQQRLDRATAARAKILDAREDVPYRDRQRRLAEAERQLDAVRLTGDACVSAFFAGSKKKHRDARCQELFGYVCDWYASGDAASKRESIAAAAAKLLSGEHPIRPFHWEIEFPEVFSGPDGGFHVMLGNPPFINAIDGGLPVKLKAWLKTTVPFVSGAADLAFHFLSKAHMMTRSTGSVGFLMPRQFLNTSAAERLRSELMKSRPPALLHSQDDSFLFSSANVHVVSAVFARTSACIGGIGRFPQPVQIRDTNWWSALVGTNSHGASGTGVPLGDLFSIAASMTTQIAYDIKPLVSEDDGCSRYPRLVTTGLIDPFECLWEKTTCRYLKHDFKRPVVQDDRPIPERVKKRLAMTKLPKLLVAGIAGPGNRLEAFLDDEGKYVGAVSTYTITHRGNSLQELRRLCTFLNSQGVSQLVATQLAGSAMGSGLLTIPKSFLSELIIPNRVQVSKGATASVSRRTETAVREPAHSLDDKALATCRRNGTRAGSLFRR